MTQVKGVKRKRKVRLRIHQSAQLVHKNDRTRVARKDGLRIMPAQTPRSVAPTFKIKIRKKRHD